MRTLFLPDYNLHVKTNFPGRISSSKREVSRLSISRGIWVSDVIVKLHEENKLPENLGFLLDCIGLYAFNTGAIIREGNATPEGTGINLPLSALFAPDKYSNLDPLLVEQLALIQNEKVEDYVINKMVRNQLDGWFWMIQRGGILFSPHGQNALVELDKKGMYRRIIYRDFQDRRSIPSVLNEQGIALPDYLIPKELKVPEQIHISLTYDFSVGKIFFDRAFNELDKRGYDKQKLIEGTKDIFSDLSKKYNLKLSPTEIFYVYNKGLIDIVDTKNKPKYR
jgi:siderophore synthetase component